MSDVDPVSAAQIVQEDDPETQVVEATSSSHQAAEGTESSGKFSRSTLKDMAFSTEPSMSLEDVESPWNPQAGGWTRIKRSFMKATGIQGTPMILDFFVGIGEVVHTWDESFNLSEPDEDDEDDQDEDPFETVEVEGI
jgi:hypothetical protein